MELAHAQSRELANLVSLDERKAIGQYFTPLAVAELMASLCSIKGEVIRILDPGGGTGVLACALATELTKLRPAPRELHLVTYETDQAAVKRLEYVLDSLRAALVCKRLTFTFEIRARDFILDRLALGSDSEPAFDAVIMNPPYFKIAKTDARALAFPEVCHGQPNIYALFLALGLEVLRPAGQMISITPRSFMSGEYFKAFRRWALLRAYPDRIHLFRARNRAFSHDDVLQENVIARWKNELPRSRSMVALSTSADAIDAETAPATLVPLSELVNLSSHSLLIHLPANEEELAAVRTLRECAGVLRTLGFSVSTGRVVAFRAVEWLRPTPQKTERVARLLWLHNVDRSEVIWHPANNGKPEWIAVRPETKALLIPRENYVLVRRFSSKDDRYRMIAAPLLSSEIEAEWIGVENHLNVISLPDTSNDAATARRLSDYLNSEAVERYMRALSGNTQIGAAELMSLPAPESLLGRSPGH